jgi:release factor glutamine methyltransferase
LHAVPSSLATIPRRSCRFGPVVVHYDERVLTPRPWTLAQSRWAAELAAKAAPGPILELCAGAGQIGLAAAVLADRELCQVEADPVAAAFATENAARAGWAARVEVRVDPLEVAMQAGEEFPLILADPPYLPSAEVSYWPSDPVLAIDGGADGLDITRRVLAVARRHLVGGGHLLLQVAGAAQAADVLGLPACAVYFAAGDLRSVDDRRAILHLVRVGSGGCSSPRS